MDDAVVTLVIRRLRASPLPETTPAEVCYQLGFLEALDAVEAALDLTPSPAGRVAPAAAVALPDHSHGLGLPAPTYVDGIGLVRCAICLELSPAEVTAIHSTPLPKQGHLL
jgi:hypothetical protein